MEMEMEKKKIMSVDFEYLKKCLEGDEKHQENIAKQYHKFLDAIIDRAKEEVNSDSKMVAAKTDYVEALKNYLTLKVEASLGKEAVGLIKCYIDPLVEESLDELDNLFENLSSYSKPQAPKVSKVSKSDDEVIRKFLKDTFN